MLVVDDSSKENTAHNARNGGAQVITMAFNMGYGVALNYNSNRGHKILS